MKHPIRNALLAIALAAGAPVIAQTNKASAEFTPAEVRKVDKEGRKITLKHEPIRSLDMPAMTMVFGVADTTLLERVKAGDKVEVRVMDTGGGRLVVTELKPQNQAGAVQPR